jgi:hypothetical protein
MHGDPTEEDGAMAVTGSTFQPRAAWVFVALSIACIVAAAFLIRGAPTDVPGLEVATPEDVVDAILDLAFAVVGALVVTRHPGNLFGWAFLLVAVCFEASIFAGAYSTYGTFTSPGSLPAPQVLSLASDVLFVPCLVLVVTFVPLLFPTGRPPTRRWWVVGAIAGLAIALATIAMAIRPGPVDEDVATSGANPFGIAGAGGVADAMELAAILLLALAAVGSFASVVVRTRRSRGEERRQLKVFFAAVAVVFAVFFVPEEPLGLGGEAAQIALAVVGILALPTAVALALLRDGRGGASAPAGGAPPAATGAALGSARSPTATR